MKNIERKEKIRIRKKKKKRSTSWEKGVLKDRRISIGRGLSEVNLTTKLSQWLRFAPLFGCSDPSFGRWWTSMCSHFWSASHLPRWLLCVRTPRHWPISVLAGLSYFYMVAAPQTAQQAPHNRETAELNALGPCVHTAPRRGVDTFLWSTCAALRRQTLSSEDI